MHRCIVISQELSNACVEQLDTFSWVAFTAWIQPRLIPIINLIREFGDERNKFCEIVTELRTVSNDHVPVLTISEIVIAEVGSEKWEGMKKYEW